VNIEKSKIKGTGGSRGRLADYYFSPGTKFVARTNQEITIQDIWLILHRRMTTFLICLGLATLTALALSLILPKRYEGVARLKVDRESSDSFGLETLSIANDSETKLQTEVNVLWTDLLAWDVIKRLRLDQRPEVAPRRYIIGAPVCVSRPGQPIESISPECRRLLLDEFHARLHVQSIPRTEVIEIRYRATSKALAAEVVNTLADAYIDRNFQSNYQTVMRASAWLSGQLEDVKKTAEMAQQKYIEFQKQTGIIGIDATHNVLLERLSALNSQVMVAQAERIVLEARYRIAMQGDPEALAVVTPGSTLQALHSQEVVLRTQYAQLQSKFGDAYPRVVAVKAQLQSAAEATAQEIARTRQKIKAEYEAALNSETMLGSAFELEKKEALNTNDAAIQVGLLKRDVDAGGELYEQLVKKVKEAGIVAGLKATNVSVIDPAGIPINPVEPRPVMNLALGMFVGLLGGAALCFLQENIDTRISTLNDVTDICALPALGVVPNLSNGHYGLNRIGQPPNRNGNHRRIISLEQPESEMADAYRSVRTALLLSMAGTPPQVVLVTSPVPGDGKTTTGVNTAVVFAQKQQSVLLVDCDLRRADIHNCLNLPSNGGLSAALVGQDPRQFYITHPTLPNLTILPAGKRPPMPPDLLDSVRMRELVAQWRQEFSQIILDAPPVIGLSDAVILATMADRVVMVVRAKQSRRQDLRHALEILANVDAHVGGAVINDFDVHRLGYYPSLYNKYFDGNGNGNGDRKKHE
jgi:capsular exopolysaccharide synthesis family protein